MFTLLDLFCGEGGAGMGYHRAGFAVTGVDKKESLDTRSTLSRLMHLNISKSTAANTTLFTQALRVTDTVRLGICPG